MDMPGPGHRFWTLLRRARFPGPMCDRGCGLRSCVMAPLAGWEKRIYEQSGSLSGPMVAAVGAVAYLGLSLVLPLALGWSSPLVIAPNLIGTIIALVFLTGWLANRIEEVHRRHLVEWTSDLRRLNASEFEWLVGELLRREGWTVEEVGGSNVPDGNVDLVLRRGGTRTIVQCKRWTARDVGVDEIRNFLGTLLREHLTPNDGVYVTLSRFTPQACAEAAIAGLTLVDGSELYARLERVRRAEPCPNCESPMALAKSSYGWWLHCRNVGCAGKRDLGGDPGRAIELLHRPPTDEDSHDC
jgi:hypothetical protein